MLLSVGMAVSGEGVGGAGATQTRW
jgi:hypothetical protein